MAITSNQAVEAESALRAAIQLLRKAKLRGSDFVEAMVERDRALDALAKYEAKLTALEAENKRLHARADSAPAGTLAQALWQDAGMPSTAELAAGHHPQRHRPYRASPSTVNAKAKRTP